MALFGSEPRRAAILWACAAAIGLVRRCSAPQSHRQCALTGPRPLPLPCPQPLQQGLDGRPLPPPPPEVEPAEAAAAVLAEQAGPPHQIAAWCRSRSGWAAAVAVLKGLEAGPRAASATLDGVLGVIRAIYAEHILLSDGSGKSLAAEELLPILIWVVGRCAAA